MRLELITHRLMLIVPSMPRKKGNGRVEKDYKYYKLKAMMIHLERELGQCHMLLSTKALRS